MFHPESGANCSDEDRAVCLMEMFIMKPSLPMITYFCGSKVRHKVLRFSLPRQQQNEACRSEFRLRRVLTQSTPFLHIASASYDMSICCWYRLGMPSLLIVAILPAREGNRVCILHLACLLVSCDNNRIGNTLICFCQIQNATPWWPRHAEQTTWL